jgi:hypothetical protein
VINAGDPGFDQAGDSALFLGDPVKIDITADAGKRLYFFCLFHPQMQGRVNVG